MNRFFVSEKYITSWALESLPGKHFGETFKGRCPLRQQFLGNFTKDTTRHEGYT